MKQCFNIWLPDSDEHFEGMMAKVPQELLGDRMVGVYQKNKLDIALAEIKRRRVAVDVGAHCGFWSMWLAEYFKSVESFEPVPEHIECFQKNVMQKNVFLHKFALGASDGYVGMARDSENSGKSHVSGEGDTHVIALDDMKLEKVDFIKIDVEGMEAQVIDGASETIAKCRPVIIFEAKGHHERYGNERNDSLDKLLSMGMKVKDKLGCDWLMVWGKE